VIPKGLWTFAFATGAKKGFVAIIGPLNHLPREIPAWRFVGNEKTRHLSRVFFYLYV
jgi:hypothetical protein